MTDSNQTSNQSVVLTEEVVPTEKTVSTEGVKSTKVKKTKKINAVSTVLYTASTLFSIYTAYSVYDSIKYISELIEMGSIDVSSQIMDIVSYCVGTSSSYVFYALVTWALGLIITKMNILSKQLDESK